MGISIVPNRVARKQVMAKDQWNATAIAALALSNAAADKDFSNIVFPAGFLEDGAIIQSVHFLFGFSKKTDSSAAPNSMTATKTIRVKKAAGAWGTDDVVALTLITAGLATAANGVEPGFYIEAAEDVSAEVDDVENVTYNVRSEETTRTDSIVVTAASLTLSDINVGLRVYYYL